MKIDVGVLYDEAVAEALTTARAEKAGNVVVVPLRDSYVISQMDEGSRKQWKEMSLGHRIVTAIKVCRAVNSMVGDDDG